MGPEGPQRVWSGLSSWGIFNPTHSLPSPLTCQAQMMVHSRCSLSMGMSSPPHQWMTETRAGSDLMYRTFHIMSPKLIGSTALYHFG